MPDKGSILRLKNLPRLRNVVGQEHGAVDANDVRVNLDTRGLPALLAQLGDGSPHLLERGAVLRLYVNAAVGGIVRHAGQGSIVWISEPVRIDNPARPCQRGQLRSACASTLCPPCHAIR